MTSLLVAGMPNSGKSTFIAALRHLLLADEVTTDLALVGLSANEAHLNRLESEWLACKRIERTKPATEGWVELHVTDRKTANKTKLLIPDLRGETFEQPACVGQCQSDLLEALAASSGLLLFTNADREDDAMLIEELADMFDPEPAEDASSQAAAPGDDSAEPGGRVESNAQGRDHNNGVADEDLENDSISEQRFRPEDMPEEVKVVEFLQVANRRPLRARHRKIAVIVSAWDLVMRDETLTPDEWLKTRRPMLAQFLETNEDVWDVRVYGVSAQGGRLPQDKEALENIRRPSERICIKGHDAGAHDISAPLRWLLHSSNGRDAVEI